MKLGSVRQPANSPSSNPVGVTRFRYTAGMIWSVSTFERRSGTPIPLCVVKDSIEILLEMVSGSDQIGRCRERSADRRGSRDERGNQMSPAAFTLSAFEIPVGRRCRTLAGSKLVRVHSQAHRAKIGRAHV